MRQTWSREECGVRYERRTILIHRYWELNDWECADPSKIKNKCVQYISSLFLHAFIVHLMEVRLVRIRVRDDDFVVPSR